MDSEPNFAKPPHSTDFILSTHELSVLEAPKTQGLHGQIRYLTREGDFPNTAIWKTLKVIPWSDAVFQKPLVILLVKAFFVKNQLNPVQTLQTIYLIRFDSIHLHSDLSTNS
jgi:hypothetical protein